jgi:hypothetical protein
MSTPAIILHGTELSGHAHRVELMLRMLGLPYQYVDVPSAAPDPCIAGRRSDARGQQCHPGLSRQTLCAGEPVAAARAGRRRAGTALAVDRGRRTKVWSGACANDHALEFSRGSRACAADCRSPAPLHERTSRDSPLSRGGTSHHRRRCLLLLCRACARRRHPARRILLGARLAAPN